MMIEHRSFGDSRKQPRAKRYLLLAVFMLGAGGWLWYRSALGAMDASDDRRVPVTVPTGAALSMIAADLEEKDLIRSSMVFSWHARLRGSDRLLRAGSYILQPSMTVDEILRILAGGETSEVSVTIPEGFTVTDIDRLMASKGFTETGVILACSRTCAFDEFSFLPAESEAPGGRAEGFLFPDTYFVGGEGSDPEVFLGRLLSTFRTKVVHGLSSEIAASGKSLHEVVTMASLIEEEAADDSERATIAGILWKRRDEGSILGVDAAVRYIVGKKTEPLTRSDLAIDSPYNIRARQGLPPGPIANPGLASIRAALEPKGSPYYYYLHGTDGRVHYAVTNDEHNANKARYLR